MTPLTLEKPPQNLRFIHMKNQKPRTKKVSDILAKLGLDTLGSQKDTLSIDHDEVLYK